MTTISPAHQIRCESAALRRLARGLLRDDDLAEEALQQTRVALWRRGGASDKYRRGAVRHVAAHLRRDERRRRAREIDAGRARPESAVATDHLVTRHEIAQQVANAVAGLREPFRESIVLRFYEGLPPRTIARRLQVPVATVRSRVQRGLAALREALDRRCGDRETWRLGLATTFGIAKGSGLALSATTHLLGGWIMSKVAVSLCVLIAALLLIWSQWPAADEGLLAREQAQPVAPAAGAPLATPEPATSTERAAAARSVVIPSARSWRIVAVDADEQPVSGAAVFAGSDSNRMRQIGQTDGRGEVELRVTPDDDPPRLVLAAGAGHQPSAPVALANASGDEIRLILLAGAAGRVRGRILDPTGNPLEDVAVYAGRNEPPSESQRARGIVSKTPGLVATTAGDGTFSIDGVLAGWFRFIIMHPRYAPAVLFHEVEAGDEVWIERHLREGTVVTGRVFDPSGRPLAGATVRQGPRNGFETRTASTAADGTYHTGPLIAGQSVEVRDPAGRGGGTVRIPKDAGSVFVWNPVLGEGETRIRGRILGSVSAPDVGGLTVRIGPRGQRWSDEALADGNGRFAVTVPRGRVMRTGVFRDPEGLPLLLRDLEITDPNQELRLELTAGQGTGRVIATVPTDLESLTLVRQIGIAPTTVGMRVIPVDGAYAWDAVPGGSPYRVVADLGAAGEYALARFEMPLGGEDIDLGELPMPQLAAVEFRIERDPSADGSTIQYLLERADDNAARLLDAVGPLPAGPHMLPAGRYRLDVELTPGIRRSTSFEVRSGEALQVPVRIDARPDHHFVITGLERGEGVRLRIWRVDEAGRDGELIERSITGEPAGGNATFGPIPLAYGQYRIEVLAAGGRRFADELRILTSEFKSWALRSGFYTSGSGSDRRLVIDLW